MQKVTIIGGGVIGLATAYALVRMGLTTSKVRTYATPRAKKVVGWPMRFGR